MSKRLVPAIIEWHCDGCGGVKQSDSRPSHWSKVTIARDAYDFQGAPVADATSNLDLCRSCTNRFTQVVNEGFEKVKI